MATRLHHGVAYARLRILRIPNQTYRRQGPGARESGID